ncbi:lysosomal Pro-X carboxypeptidase-like [Tribolium madens]|uniref:lysosomal Pro-X carboxypeptidase-like n=1 Tax=Tribolium madens TaxID=41895 RepID=UPI001CF73A18|nr:lysosomal Pro-X carboxypeptidase-like [Tribolium madens]
MRLSVTLVLFLCHNIWSYDYETKYFEVPLDHFSFTTKTTFKLKYLINDTFWTNDGPIFFYTGNEGTIENFAENTGFIFDIAPSFNALIVFAEHRYYGESLPFGNDSFSSLGHLGYLTSSQALADFVDLIDFLSLGKVPVVAFGGSYGGMLSSWLRMKYPASVVGAIAASAPIWQFETSCENFYKVVTQVYKAVTEDCPRLVTESWEALRNIAASAEGKAWLSEAWQLCSPIETPGDVETLIGWYSEILVNMAMVNYPYSTSFLAPLPPFPVKNFCTQFTEANIVDDKSLIMALGDALQIYTNFSETTTCNKINQAAEALGEEGWGFQACTEMIMPMCSIDGDMFENNPWDYGKYASQCLEKWGVNQTHPELPVLEYGGKDIKAASNIVFSNGLLDPWSTGGVLSNVSESVVAVIIPDGAHHIDLRGGNEDDPQTVIEARQFHVENIKKWIREFYFQNDGFLGQD